MTPALCTSTSSRDSLARKLSTAGLIVVKSARSRTSDSRRPRLEGCEVLMVLIADAILEAERVAMYIVALAP